MSYARYAHYNTNCQLIYVLHISEQMSVLFQCGSFPIQWYYTSHREH